MSDVFKGKRLLVVEDEADLREPLMLEFESLGCIVFGAGNGKEALEIVKAEQLDAIISDIRMPGGDCVELLKSVKAIQHNFPVVMLITGFADLSREEAYHLGAEAILTKPFNLDEIDAVVERILTPKEILWQRSPDPKTVKSKIESVLVDVANITIDGNLKLGRGGFFYQSFDKIGKKDDVVSLYVRFEKGELLLLEGTGVIRWVRATSQGNLLPGYGIEFESLDNNSKEKIIEILDALKLVPFIPMR